mmetsp:Transcript_34106/g.67811  ORF Transcript_34106/g.67811 Transcript_34106/m.67811 type:complete len:318 (+) Transcript_34106:125-1078(+)|eukprot:CAMPEP_0170213442 /NCGR_PEP_ID=MMETSP0116_2-20130129/6345_1 /TAXON_ID=400756 /ORGANISM="Durinskia baltica, Strain CSIRO CS-38" /LENGTH=317 /DNA_ID=CAMNT_0010463993 /DNA_START=121 /DNA_END=1074 /DNA_ORIENTATION=-
MTPRHQFTKSRNIRTRLALCFGVFLCNGICAFQMSMVASRAPFTRSYDGTSSQNQNSFSRGLQTSTPSNGITGGLISNLAIVALKMRLKDQTHVGCDVTASSTDILLKGQVGPVTVKGRGWKSRLGLTCRAIEATVDKCLLDVGRIVSNQKLVLTTPAEGNAMVALNAADFGNFITHPLMKTPDIPEIQGLAGESAQLKFLKEDVTIDPSTGAVSFYGSYLDAKWRFDLCRGSNGRQAAVFVHPMDSIAEMHGHNGDSIAASLTHGVSRFFNEMVFELDGTFLSFRDMMVTGKGKEPSVMLSLSILVKKFPSPGLEF